ncbi:hypothetical protein F5Y10DRAFT_78743 [Nemania abortiva]|nr:hypothetical protein F5Y10DRAFT_78743 [Nemania abortiva]
MANSNQPAQTPEGNNSPILGHSQVKQNVYNLDDPYLIDKILSGKPIVAGPITCRFIAIPLNEPGSFSTNLAQYGHVVFESRDRLIMHVPGDKIDLLDRIQQVWVSKYLAPFTECMITFDLPRNNPERTTKVIIQRVLPSARTSTSTSTSINTADAALEGGDPTAAADGGSEMTTSSARGVEEEPCRKRRVG